jgi:hypothetical protein
MAIGCTPATLHMNHHSMTSSLTIHPLIQQDSMLDIVDRISFVNICHCELLQCVLQVHKENGHCIKPNRFPYSANNHVYLEKPITLSRLSKFLDNITFVEASKALIDFLNMDLRLCPSLLHAMAALYTGCIIVDGPNIVFVRTAEAYARTKSVNAHVETSLKLMPILGATYQRSSIGVHEEADSGSVKKKLNIGSTNVLVNMSISIASSI